MSKREVKEAVKKKNQDLRQVLGEKKAGDPANWARKLQGFCFSEASRTISSVLNPLLD